MKLVLFYPDPPEQLEGHTLSKTIEYFDIIGYNFTENIDDDWTIGVHWDLQDVNETPQALLEDKRPVLNRYLNNITKSHVDKIFAEVFGYSSFADTTQHGFCVRKSERQSAHDGVIVKTPCEREPGYVYQKLIDNRMGIDMVYDIRISMFMGHIPPLYIKGKSMEGLFENALSKTLKYWMSPLEEYLTDDAIMNVILFSAKIGLDLGEIDLLRDNSTGKLYIIDVNNIPGGSVFNYIEKGEEVKNQLAWIFNSVLP